MNANFWSQSTLINCVKLLLSGMSLWFAMDLELISELIFSLPVKGTDEFSSAFWLIISIFRLFELADSIEEVKTTCHFCNSKAVYNLKHVNGKADVSGPVVQLGAEEKYFPTCYVCYRNNLLEANEQIPGPI
jgi:hypothetical protein